MLSLEEWGLKYPGSRCWGSCVDMNPWCSAKLLTEGMLQFTKESASGLCGPFEGGYAQVAVHDFSDAIYLYSYHKGKPYLATLDKLEAERKEKMDRQFEYTGKKYYPNTQNPTTSLPVKLYMTGSDDGSYSKYYPSVTAALEELALFIDNQPLDLWSMIKDFNFYSHF